MPLCRVMLFGGLLLVIGALAGCKPGTEGAKKPEPKKTQPAPPPDPLAVAVDEVIATCTVLETGAIRDCKGKALEDLERLEQRRGILSSLAIYCPMMEHAQHKVRVVVAIRIGALSVYSVLARGKKELLECLTQQASRQAAELWHRERLVRAATFVATGIGEEGPLFEYLDKKAPPELRRVGYECLWPNGRMRVLDRLATAAKAEDAGLRLAAAKSFIYVQGLEPAEAKPVCRLLDFLLEDKDASVAGVAAERLAGLCPDRRGKVLRAVAKGLAQTTLGPSYVAALERLYPAKPREAGALLSRVVNERKLHEPVRAAALAVLTRLDSQKAKKLARDLIHDKSEGETLRGVAEAALK